VPATGNGPKKQPRQGSRRRAPSRGAQHTCHACSCAGNPRLDGRRALPVWRPPPDIVGVGRACHRPQPDTIDRGHHPGRRKEASPHLYCQRAKGNQPVQRYAQAGSGAHQGGNGSSHLSIVIAGRLERRPKASHGRCTCMISWGTMVRPSCMT
jgi:hypothetical protein